MPSGVSDPTGPLFQSAATHHSGKLTMEALQHKINGETPFHLSLLNDNTWGGIYEDLTTVHWFILFCFFNFTICLYIRLVSARIV